MTFCDDYREKTKHKRMICLCLKALYKMYRRVSHFRGFHDEWDSITKILFWLGENRVLASGNIKKTQFLENYFIKQFSAKDLQLHKIHLIWTFLHICKKVKIRILELLQFKNSTFIRCTVKQCFEEIGHRKLTAKFWLSILYSFVTVQCLKIRTSFSFRCRFLQGYAKICLFRDFG